MRFANDQRLTCTIPHAFKAPSISRSAWLMAKSIVTSNEGTGKSVNPCTYKSRFNRVGTPDITRVVVVILSAFQSFRLPFECALV
jgi:hypothetical protein